MLDMFMKTKKKFIKKLKIKILSSFNMITTCETEKSKVLEYLLFSIIDTMAAFFVLAYSITITFVILLGDTPY